jgi:hypothetical protein
MSQPVRRVVTGHDSEGRAVFVSDALVEPVVTALSPATAFHQIWGGDGPPSFPDDGTRPPSTTYFPPVGGFRWSNPGDAPATLAVFICGANHAGIA